MRGSTEKQSERQKMNRQPWCCLVQCMQDHMVHFLYLTVCMCILHLSLLHERDSAPIFKKLI